MQIKIYFNDFDTASIKKAEKRKTELENKGYRLISTKYIFSYSRFCMTFKKI